MKKLFLGIILFLVYIIVGTIFNGDHYYMILTMLLATFLVTFFLCYKNIIIIKKDIFFLVWLIIFILFISSFIKKDFSRTLVYIIFIPIFSLFGYLYSKKKSFLMIFLTVFLCLSINFYIQPNFLIFYHNSDKENILTNKVIPKFELFDSKNIPTNLPEDKIVILDFWNTSCSVCFNEFPKMNVLYNKYKNDKKVLIVAINVPVNNEDFKSRKESFENEKLDFKTLYTKSTQDIQSLLNFNTYPNIIILKNNRIVFSGNIEPLSDIFSYHYVSIDKKIEELLISN